MNLERVHVVAELGWFESVVLEVSSRDRPS